MHNAPPSSEGGRRRHVPRCLGMIEPGWVADVAHDPREDVDDRPRTSARPTAAVKPTISWSSIRRGATSAQGERRRALTRTPGGERNRPVGSRGEGIVMFSTRRLVAAAIPAALACLGIGAGNAIAAPSTPKISWSKCFADIGQYECGTVQVPSTTTAPRAGRSRSRSSSCPRPIRHTASARSSSTPAAPAARAWNSRSSPARTLHAGSARTLRPRRIRPARDRAEQALRCFGNDKQWAPYFTPFAFPLTVEEEQAWIAADLYLDGACAQRGGRIIDHMSTANVARDLDVLREAVGDAKLTAGYSAGRPLGQVYASMFPANYAARHRRSPRSDRVGQHRRRDPVLDPPAQRCRRDGDHRRVLPPVRPGRASVRVRARLGDPVRRAGCEAAGGAGVREHPGRLRRRAQLLAVHLVDARSDVRLVVMEFLDDVLAETEAQVGASAAAASVPARHSSPRCGRSSSRSGVSRAT